MAVKGKSVKLEYHGSILKIDRMKQLINHTLDANEAVINRKGANQGKKTAICIWGKHGIGKTAMPEQIAAERGIGFSKISPAQFEEMGDLLGMPMTSYYMIKADESKLVDEHMVETHEKLGWVKDTTKDSVTGNAAPHWVPKVELGANEYGIFCIDDINRGAKRIINGCMDLLQNGGLSSWKLPKGWTIIATANPGGGDYQITELDAAQLTRMTHFSMEFEPKEWARWAVNNHIDERVINFVLKYPELISTGELTTPRSIEYFSNNIKNIGDLKANLDLVQIFGNANLDENAAMAFTSFINDNLTTLLSPEDILNAKNFETEVKKGMMDTFTKCTPQRVDVISILATRMILYCADVLEGKLEKKQIENLKEFINIKELPNDIRLSMAQDLVKCNGLKSIMADPEIGKLLLKKM